jgi:ABC-type multidrug transport system fused ATPase/permease subunit
MRFYNPASGSITFDGKPIESLDLRSYRRAVGYIGQEPVLFNDTIKANMLLSNPDATESDIMKALEQASCMSFIKKL